MNTDPILPGLESLVKPFRFPATPHEFKVVALRECPTPESMLLCDDAEKAAEYWRAHIATHPFYNAECECFVMLILNARRRIKGHYLVSVGTMDTILVHPREVYRLAIVTNAHSVIALHNHPSGDPTPSEADVKVTRDLIRAGHLLRIELLDHVIVTQGKSASLRSMGYFYS
jgi:DNA repair protein RadC